MQSSHYFFLSLELYSSSRVSHSGGVPFEAPFLSNVCLKSFGLFLTGSSSRLWDLSLYSPAIAYIVYIGSLNCRFALLAKPTNGATALLHYCNQLLPASLSLWLLVYPPHFDLMGVCLKPHSGPVQDSFTNARTFEMFIEEIMPGVGDQDNFYICVWKTASRPFSEALSLVRPKYKNFDAIS